MKNLSLILFLFTILQVNCKGQQHEMKQVEIITNFIDKVKAGISNDILIEKFLAVSDQSKKNLEFVNLQLDGLRDKLKTIDSVRVSKYDSQSVQLILSHNEEDRVFLVSGKTMEVVPILMKGDRISSFSTINKSGKRIFLLL